MRSRALPTPELEFGDDKQFFTDPRVGLASAGPFSLRFGRAHIAKLRIGLVGVREQTIRRPRLVQALSEFDFHGKIVAANVHRLSDGRSIRARNHEAL
jgi:hypothetical protein